MNQVLNGGLADLPTYIVALKRHDWSYQYSDDHTVWSRGRDRQAQLEAARKHSPNHSKAFMACSLYGHGHITQQGRDAALALLLEEMEGITGAVPALG